MIVEVICTSFREQASYVRLLRASVGAHEPSVKVNWETSTDPCAKAQNIAIKRAINIGYLTGQVPDWYLVTDVDVICKAPFVDILKFCDPYILWGNKIHPAGTYGSITGWIDGWIMAISRKMWQEVGEYDENFLGSGFEDADYCFRAQKQGYSIGNAGFPFHHLEAGVKNIITPKYGSVRQKNLDYLKEKHHDCFE